MRNISDGSYRENRKTHFVFGDFSPKIVVFQTMWDKYGTTGQATGDNIIWRMHIACCITNAAGTHSEYVMLIDFPR
jgi:hypothetical protein